MIGFPIASETDYFKASRNPAIRRSLMEHLRFRKQSLSRALMALGLSIGVQVACLVAQLSFATTNSVTTLFIVTCVFSLLACLIISSERGRLDSRLQMMDERAVQEMGLSSTNAGYTNPLKSGNVS